MRILWICLGLVCVALGAVGVFVPLLPTTPFMLLAAFAFARSSPRLHKWLIEHKVFGPLILNWQAHGAISARAKVLSVVSIVAIATLSLVMGVPRWALLTQWIVLACVTLFILTRPLPPE